MKPLLYLSTIALAAIFFPFSAFGREVEGASVSDRGRTHDARGGSNRSEHSGDKRSNGDRPREPSANRTVSNAESKSKPAAKESNFAKSAKATQAMADSIQKDINTSKDKIAKLRTAADISRTDRKIEKNKERIRNENAKQISKSLKDRIVGFFKDTNPVSDAIDKSKETKALKDRLIDTLSYDKPGWDTIEAMDKLEHERKNLDKLEHTKKELEKIRDAFKKADDKFQQEQNQRP